MDESELELTALIDRCPAYKLYNGKLKNESVLIKCPACEDSIAKSRHEIKILQDLGRKEHIVNLLGHFIDDTLPFNEETNKATRQAEDEKYKKANTTPCF